MLKLVECVPNFSEGRDMATIDQITSEIRATEGVKLLDVDPGKDTNRTVVTFIGTPDAVVDEAPRGPCPNGCHRRVSIRSGFRCDDGGLRRAGTKAGASSR